MRWSPVHVARALLREDPMNAFEKLGLELELTVSEEEVREAFRRKAAEAHPDSGGSEQEFSGLQAAREVLLGPSARLREWLAAKGVEVDPRGQIEASLMDLFQKVAETGSGAEEAIRRNAAAQSALAKAMLEVQLMARREKLKDLLAEVETEIRGRIDRFAMLEKNQNDAAKILRDLIFLEKWRGTLKGLYGRLM
ncbi:J domain-containing protein [Luteolibacter algae]|uniref:J domain-containing protein n=1 Tax=Luteolibacter algae TaxID=454151 RepID=A0ABW5D5K6_9BACT